jgi:hypothetical protein
VFIKGKAITVVPIAMDHLTIKMKTSVIVWTMPKVTAYLVIKRKALRAELQYPSPEMAI